MSPAKVLFHTCGSVVDIMGDMVDIGVDVLHPIQVTARGMEIIGWDSKSKKLVHWIFGSIGWPSNIFSVISLRDGILHLLPSGQV